MEVVNMIALCIGYAVMAAGGIGLLALLVYVAATELFRVALNRRGGFKVLARYIVHEVEFLHWLSKRTAQEDTPDAAR